MSNATTKKTAPRKSANGDADGDAQITAWSAQPGVTHFTGQEDLGPLAGGVYHNGFPGVCLSRKL
jgi:hypothetical protein